MKKLIKILSVTMSLFIIVLTIPFCVSALAPDSSTTYKGIDVSVFQGDIDFNSVENNGIEFVYIRAGLGNDTTDANFEENYNKITQTGLKFGFYYFVTATTVEQAEYQATRFAKLISGKTFTGRPAMDFEQFNGLSSAQINQVGLAFLNKLKALTNINPIIYTDAYNASNLWNSSFSQFPLWVADYNGLEQPPDNNIWSSYAGYQYADNGRISGISSNVDLDIFSQGALISDNEAKPPVTKPDEITYTVKKGDTLWAISKRYGVAINSIVKANNIANPNLIYVGEVFKIPSDSTTENYGSYYDYTVVKGDTLWSISRKFGTTVNEIVKLNKISNPNLIYAGEVFRIPTKTPTTENNGFYYIVQRGDTLWAISRRYGTTVNSIVQLNNIKNPNLIYSGERLYIINS